MVAVRRAARWGACLLIGAAACHDDTAPAGEASGSDTSGPAAATTGLDPDSSSTQGTTAIEPDASSSSSSDMSPVDLPPAIVCAPSGGGPYWVLEGEPVAITIVCTQGEGLPGDAFAIDPLPAGASYDPTTATLSWTPGLDQAAVYELGIAVDATGESTTVELGVVDAWDAPGNIPVVDPAIYTEEYGLPVLHLSTSPDINDAEYTPATAVYRGHTYTIEAKHRGAASLWYPKQSFTLEFDKDDKFDEPDFAGGFEDKRRVVLISTFDDNTFVRQRLAYELWNRLDSEHIQIQVYSGVVFLDGEYHGLYTFADHVDGYLMEDHDLYQDGNLYKARTHDANFRLDGKTTPHDGLTKEEGVPEQGQPGAFADLDALVTFVATSNDATFDAEVDARIDRRDYENWWIFVSLIMGDDSAGKNSYHYHDPAVGPWRFAPWDFNDSFGQTWQTARKGFDAHPEDYTWANELFVRLLDSAVFGAPLRARYDAVLHAAYDIDTVLALYDAMIDETAPSALRDEGRWGAEYIDYGGWNWRDDFLTSEQEVEYTRQWIIDRWAFVDDVY